MKTWSIDNYDGNESYGELGMELIKRQWMETPMEPQMFQQMRRNMLAIELEMDDALTTKATTQKEKEREWHGLTDLVLSLCNDYLSGALNNNARTRATESDRGLHATKEQVHYHDAGTRDDHVGRSHVVSVNDQGESDQETTCCPSENEEQGVTKTVSTKKVWQPQGQTYRVQQWIKAIDECVNGSEIGCVMATAGRTHRRCQEDYDSDCDDGELVCNMIGQQWEDFPFPIIIDSGACASVMPTSWCSHVPIQETPQSKAGEFYRAANGQKIYQEGERIVSMMTQEGSMRDMRFTVCEVSKALGSVSQMCKTGHRVVFNPPWCGDGSYIEQVDTGERMWLREEGGLYVLRTKVAPSHRQSGGTRIAGFPWQVTAP